MLDHDGITASILDGRLLGFNEKPKKIEAAISTVFVFEELGKALKLYKRNSEYFNTHVQNISSGKERIEFITKDFVVDNKLNPDIYLNLKTIKSTDNGNLELIDAVSNDDNLIIVMNSFNTRNLFTDVLYEGKLTNEIAFAIGKQITEQRLSFKDFRIEVNTQNWYELLKARITDIEKWPAYVPEFDQEVAQIGFKKLYEKLEELKSELSEQTDDVLWVSTDCVSENSYLENGKLYFFDICHPQKSWRTSDFNFDLIRTGNDIWAFAGKEIYDSFISGVNSVSNKKMGSEKEILYRLFASLVMNIYLYNRSQTDPKFTPMAEKYLLYTKDLMLSS